MKNKLIEKAEMFLDADDQIKKSLINYYNSNCIDLVKPSRKYKMRYSDEWCAAFVSVIAHMVGYSKNDFPFEVSVREQVLLAKNMGRYFEGVENISEGDLIIFDWFSNGTLDHVGLVKTAGYDYITTIEGNYQGTVKNRVVSRYSRVIRGYIRLGIVEVDNHREIVLKLAREVLRGVHGNGLDRSKSLGAYAEEVQRLVNKLLK